MQFCTIAPVMALEPSATWADHRAMDLEELFALRVVRLLSSAKRQRVMRAFKVHPKGGAVRGCCATSVARGGQRLRCVAGQGRGYKSPLTRKRIATHTLYGIQMIGAINGQG
jgi:hypothetical protein